MELLLNLVWLLLALPACWLWRSARTARAEQKFTSLQCLIALGCLLVLLFPVISATDDLQAMRTEMEESPVSKRSIRHAGNDRASAWNSGPQTLPVLLGARPSFGMAVEHSDLPPIVAVAFSSVPSPLTAGRAPPLPSLV